MEEEKKSVGAEMVPAERRVITAQQIEDAGLLMPLVDPAALRAAFAERQRVLTSILDPNRDFVYSVRYFDRENKQRTYSCGTLDEAKKQAKHLTGEERNYSAHPKKSGVLKLAHALGIESRMVSVEGLPKDPRATWSSCRYLATHKRTNRQEEGQGYCDKTEKGGGMHNHAIISMADTRAYCKAVLRCAGYDNVGADEIDLDDSVLDVRIETDMPERRERPALAETHIPTTLTDAMTAPAATAPVTTPAPVAAPASTPAPVEQPTPASTPLPASPPPDGPGKGDVITNAMAAKLSKLMIEKCGSKEKAREWLQRNAGVERSIYVRQDQVGELEKKLEAMEVG